jgi:hypothetical protein
MIPLPTTWSEDAPRVILGRPGCYDPEKYKMEDVMKSFLLINDLLHEEDDQMLVAGQINIVDLKGSTLAHFTSFTPQHMKKMSMMMQDVSSYTVCLLGK